MKGIVKVKDIIAANEKVRDEAFAKKWPDGRFTVIPKSGGRFGLMWCWERPANLGRRLIELPFPITGDYGGLVTTKSGLALGVVDWPQGSDGVRFHSSYFAGCYRPKGHYGSLDKMLTAARRVGVSEKLIGLFVERYNLVSGIIRTHPRV